MKSLASPAGPLCGADLDELLMAAARIRSALRDLMEAAMDAQARSKVLGPDAAVAHVAQARAYLDAADMAVMGAAVVLASVRAVTDADRAVAQDGRA